MESQAMHLINPLRAQRKASKYKNTRVKDGDMTFDSVAEHRRYKELLLVQRAGQIAELKRQASFVLVPGVLINGVPKRAMTYRADFSYIDTKTGKKVVEDVKGAITDVYVMKRHLMKHLYGIDILETVPSGRVDRLFLS